MYAHLAINPIAPFGINHVLAAFDKIIIPICWCCVIIRDVSVQLSEKTSLKSWKTRNICKFDVSLLLQATRVEWGFLRLADTTGGNGSIAAISSGFNDNNNDTMYIVFDYVCSCVCVCGDKKKGEITPYPECVYNIIKYIYEKKSHQIATNFTETGKECVWLHWNTYEINCRLMLNTWTLFRSFIYYMAYFDIGFFVFFFLLLNSKYSINWVALEHVTILHFVRCIH